MVRINSFKILIIIAVIFSTTVTCSRKKDKEKTEQRPQETLEIEEGERIDRSVDKEDYQNEFEKVVNEIGKIQAFTPETFVIITILNKKMTRQWLDEARALSPEDQKKYIDEENLFFFNAFGITEEQFIRYSQENIEELDNYMQEHPELISELQEY